MSSEPELNPYEAPTIQDAAPAGHTSTTFLSNPWVLHGGWALAVVLNLPVPVLLGTSATDPGAAQLGMPAGIAIVYFTGLWICLHKPGLMWRLVFGSAFTALSQFVPVAHMMIGMAAIGISQGVFNMMKDDNMRGSNLSMIPEVVMATLLTGLGLIILSLVIGIVFVLVFRIRMPDEQRPV